jgi:quinol monooxygenase YgiN
MTAGSVRMTVEWLVPVAQARSITLALHALASATRPHQGCLGCAVSTDFAHQGRVSYVEEWATGEDLQRRLTAPSFIQLATLIEDVSRPPRIELTVPDLQYRAGFIRDVRNAVKQYRDARNAGGEIEQPVRRPRRRPAGGRLLPRDQSG